MTVVEPPLEIEYVNITKDVSGNYSIVLTKFNNGDFYFQAYGEEENEWGDLYSLSQENIAWLNGTYNNYYYWTHIRHTTLDPNSIEYKVYLARKKLITTINKGTWAVSIDSDEFYGMWMHYTMFEGAYGQAAHLVADMVNTAFIIGTTVYQTVVTVKAAVTLAQQTGQISAQEYATQAAYVEQLENSLKNTSYSNRTTTTAEARNIELAKLGYTDAPCKQNTPVIGFKTTQATSNQYIKLGASDNIQPGAFVTKLSDIQGLTPQQIQSKLALPYTPTHYKYVNIPANQQMYASITNGLFGGTGDFVQYDLGMIPPASWYSVAYPLT